MVGGSGSIPLASGSGSGSGRPKNMCGSGGSGSGTLVLTLCIPWCCPISVDSCWLGAPPPPPRICPHSRPSPGSTAAPSHAAPPQHSSTPSPPQPSSATTTSLRWLLISQDIVKLSFMMYRAKCRRWLVDFYWSWHFSHLKSTLIFKQMTVLHYHCHKQITMFCTAGFFNSRVTESSFGELCRVTEVCGWWLWLCAVSPVPASHRVVLDPTSKFRKTDN
jgi:hypothetical protein